jgi:hypothetical protein
MRHSRGSLHGVGSLPGALAGRVVYPAAFALVSYAATLGTDCAFTWARASVKRWQ